MKYELFDADYDSVVEESDSIIRLKWRAKLSYGIPLNRWNYYSDIKEWLVDGGVFQIRRKKL